MSYIKNLSTFKKVLYASFILILLFNLVIPSLSGDDLFYYNAISGHSFNGQFLNDLPKFIFSRYHIWSSRVVIEFFLTFLTQHVFIWKILATGVTCLYIILMNYYFNTRKSLNILLVILTTLFSLPNSFFSETGWIATTTNYFWAITFALAAFYPFFQKLMKRKINWFFYSAALIIQIFASNQEQINACFLGLTTCLIVYLAFQKQKIWILLPNWVLSIGGAIFSLTTPGNKLRYASELKHWFPDYAHFGLLRKLELGFSSTGKATFFDFNLSALLFFIVLALLSLLIIKNKYLKMMTLVPLITNIMFYIFKINRPNPNSVDDLTNNFLKHFTNFGTDISLKNPRSIMPDLFILILLIITTVSIWLIIENHKKALLIIILLAMGFASKFIMAFSPTIWASGIRVNFSLYVSLIMATLILLNEYEIKNPEGMTKFMNLYIPSAIVAGILMF
ncbi:DUF6056 family protein [Lactobacillus sp. YT155]|uniref:DUF6056 family protein n=1 Tax=Lactobacillus sp. YT155 TaxID=3060955 RepID=UPI00265F2009|nr:DUF6056 family protein [Lactobacillus sp. YT155]MDO1605713.1 DUF6056 family protein [Lactobacillus sp. YT155]